MPESHSAKWSFRLEYRSFRKANRGRRVQVPNDLDLRMMARCIEISRDSIAAGELPFRLRDLSRRGGRVGSHQPRGTRRRRDPSRRNGCDVGSATHPRNQAVVALHALYQCRALRDVLLLHSRDPDALDGWILSRPRAA